MAWKKLEATVIGRVQGVGYRFFVEHMANLLGVTGWVSNLPTGDVKVVAVGREDTIPDLLRSLREGPSMSRVDEVKSSVETVETNDYDTFEIML